MSLEIWIIKNPDRLTTTTMRQWETTQWSSSIDSKSLSKKVHKEEALKEEALKEEVHRNPNLAKLINLLLTKKQKK
jgi:hypothetical protein